MISLLKIILIGITAVIIITLIKTYIPQYTIEATICASIILLYLVIDGLSYCLIYFSNIYEQFTYGKEYFPIIIKVLSIAYITEFAVALCQDAGEKAISSKLELAGKIAIFISAIPVFNSLLSLLNNLT